jgi:isoleucyl-tRNA synthetase
MAIDGIVPYKNVLTHGFVVDGLGKKMSKSLGNVITPEKVMKKYGADILRLWVASSDYSEDIRLSDEILTRLADAYRKIRNTYKYLLSNLFDFDPFKDVISYGDMMEIDKWILSRLSGVIKEAEKNYETFEFHKVYRDVYNFCVYEVSSVYLDILKDRMYTFKADSRERRSGQTAMYELLTGLLKIMAPILPMTTDEAWGYVQHKDVSSIHLESWPREEQESFSEKGLNDKWARLIALREAVLKRLEEKRQANEIGSGLEARVALATDDRDYKKLLKENLDILRYIFIVSQVELKDGAIVKSDLDPAVPVAIYIEKAKGVKCQRCWNYSEKVGLFMDHPTLCERCVKAIEHNVKLTKEQ